MLYWSFVIVIVCSLCQIGIGVAQMFTALWLLAIIMFVVSVVTSFFPLLHLLDEKLCFIHRARCVISVLSWTVNHGYVFWISHRTPIFSVTKLTPRQLSHSMRPSSQTPSLELRNVIKKCENFWIFIPRSSSSVFHHHCF